MFRQTLLFPAGAFRPAMNASENLRGGPTVALPTRDVAPEAVLDELQEEAPTDQR